MANRDNSVKRAGTTVTSATAAKTATTAEAMEQRVMAFAEQLGRIAGTVQAKTEGWMDVDALNKQIASVRDSASELLEELKAGVARATGGGEEAAGEATRTASSKNKGRSGGVVDAPGKKHRRPTPPDPHAVAADAKASNIRSGQASMKTMKRRGRG